MTNKENYQKTITVVLGMHRSGTSVITRGLKALGVDLGENLMPEAVANNAKGFWEDLDINTLNIDLLNALGYDWHTIVPISTAELTSPVAESFKLRAVELLRNKLKDTAHFGLKDPRICRLLPFWQSVFEHLHVITNYIIACRNPMSVARSLNKRDSFDLEKSYYLWIDHMLKSITNTVGKNRIVVDYDLLIENPTEQLKRIAKSINLNFDTDSVNLATYSKEFLEGSLRHTQYQEKDLLLEAAAPKMAIDIYHFLTKVARDESSLDDSKINALFESNETFYQQHLPALKYIKKIETNLSLSNHKTIETSNTLSECNSKLLLSDQIISNINNQLTESKKQLSEYKSKLLTIKSELEKNQNISKEKDNLINGLNNNINELYNSTSWKVSKPVRILGNLKTKNTTKIFIKSIQLGGGLLPTLKKSLKVYRREGLSGIKSRLFIAKYHSENTLNNISHNIFTTKNKTQQINWLAETRKIDIEPYDIISFDVFDTAVIRLFESPVDVFDYIEKYKKIANFKSKRINSETKAREKNSHKKDINLNDIYDQLDYTPDLELEYELTFISANPVIYDLYSRAKSANKKIYFVSDMYLTDIQIKNILNKSGYTSYDALYVSSMDDLPKGDGSRFIELKEQVGEQKILHIGDNALADYEWPKKLGIDSIKYHAPEEFFRSDSLIGPMYDNIKQHDSLNLSFLLGLYRKWKYGDKSSGWSIWRDIGFLFGGPLIYSFAQHIHKLSKNNNHTHLHFLARDGMIIKNIYDLFFKHPNQKTSYLLASRRAMTFPLFSMDKEQCKQSKPLELYSATHRGSTAEEIFERLAYPDLNGILVELKNAVKKDSILNKKSIKKILEKNYSLLNLKAQKELSGLISYLDGEDFFTNAATLIDVGWNGTIQDSLIKLLEFSDKKQKINGIYLGISPSASNLNNKNGFIFDANNLDIFQQASPYLDFIELLTSAPDKGLLKFTENHPFVEFSETCEQEQYRFEIAKEIQHGIIDYAQQLKDFDAAILPKFSANDFINIFEALSCNTDPDIISIFNSVKHSRMPSNSYIHSIINFEKRNAK